MVAVNTIDSDALYLKFINILTGAFWEQGEDAYLSVSDIALSMYVNDSHIRFELWSAIC